jgi:hypothetical protein
MHPITFSPRWDLLFAKNFEKEIPIGIFLGILV